MLKCVSVIELQFLLLYRRRCILPVDITGTKTIQPHCTYNNHTNHLIDHSRHGILLKYGHAAPLVSTCGTRPEHHQVANRTFSSCIAYKTTILTEHTTSAASATSSLASLILPKIDHSQPQKLTYTHGQNHIHYISDAGPATSTNAPGLTYLVIAKQDLGRRIPFGYLVEIKKRFLSQFASSDLSHLPAYGAAAFNSELKKLMVEFGTTKAGQDDAFRNVQSEIDNVRDIMSQNIEQVLERGERIDLLVDKTDRLGGSARDFRVRSRGLRRRMWWKNVRLMVMLVFVVLFLMYLLIGFGCGEFRLSPSFNTGAC